MESSIETLKQKKSFYENIRKELPIPQGVEEENNEEVVEGKEEESDDENAKENADAEEDKVNEEDDVEKFSKVSAAELIGVSTDNSVVADEEETQKNEEVKQDQ